MLKTAGPAYIIQDQVKDKKAARMHGQPFCIQIPVDIMLFPASGFL
jgi:hypothetical protein